MKRGDGRPFKRAETSGGGRSTSGGGGGGRGGVEGMRGAMGRRLGKGHTLAAHISEQQQRRRVRQSDLVTPR